MPDFYEMFETPKIHWPITFVVDTSGSMTGQRPVQLNSALHELSNILESLAYQGDIQLSIRLIEFNTTARWVLGDEEKCVDHLEVYFSEASGLTNTGEALRLARSAMNRTCMSERFLKPILFLITDGMSIDSQNTFDAIDELKCAFGSHDILLRVALEIGDEWIPELEEFVSQSDLIFKVDDLGHIKGADLLSGIIAAICFKGVHDYVSPYDDDDQIPDIISDDSEWEEDWEE